MDRLILLQAAIDAAKDWYDGLICGSFRGLEKRLKALPSAQLEPQSPCDLCVHNPPSSMDEKPCCMCVAEPWRGEEHG